MTGSGTNPGERRRDTYARARPNKEERSLAVAAPKVFAGRDVIWWSSGVNHQRRHIENVELRRFHPTSRRNSSAIYPQKYCFRGSAMQSSQATDLGNKTYDFKGLLEAMRDAQQKPLEIMKVHQATTEIKISAFGKVSAAVEGVKVAAAALAASNSAITATVSGKGFTATARGDATASVYQIEVSALATSQTLRSEAFTNRTEPIGTGGSIAIQLVNGKSVSVALKADTSLNGITQAINSSNAGVLASVVNNDAGESYLLLSSKETGIQASIAKIEVTDNTELAAKIGFDAAASSVSKLAVATTAANAEVVINGIAVTSGSNTIDSAIDGVVFSLTEKTPAGSPSTLTLARNNAEISNAADVFVTAYNAAQSMLSELTAYTPGAKSQNSLFADGTARRIQIGLANALHGVTNDAGIRSLAKLGISTETKTGLLTLKQSELDSALLADPASVASLFSGKNGLGSKFELATRNILGDGKTITGSLPNTVSTLQSLAKTQEKTYAALETSSNKQIDILNAQFNALALTLAKIDASRRSLERQFPDKS
jgi:flagellar hook-associated protein 2